MSKKVKIFVIVILVIAVLIGLFSYFGNQNPVTANTGLSASSSQGPVIPGGGTGDPSTTNSGEFAASLSSISTISLDTSIFSNPAYEALRDYPVSLGTAIVGRPNPFAPIGVDSNNTNVAPSLQIQTLAPGKITRISSELGALVTVNNTAPVTVVFEYGTTPTFGTTTAPVNVTKSGTALFTAKGLTAATTYYVQAIAVQGSFTATSNTMSFTTLP